MSDLAKKRRRKRTPWRDMRIVGIDGEGHDVPCLACKACRQEEIPTTKTCEGPRHLYTYLAAVDEQGRTVSEIYNAEGLSHEECVAMLLAIPKGCLCFAFMFSYDCTKILEDLPLGDIFYLMHPSLRDETVCKKCRKPVPPSAVACPALVNGDPCGCPDFVGRTRAVRIRGRRYDFFNGSLTIRDKDRSVKVWDCIRFFQTSFVEAIKNWKVGTPEQHARIKGMKDKRGTFEHEEPENVRRYCREECWLLALLMRKLIEAHDVAEIDLQRFDGVGSTASALLRKYEVASLRGPNLDALDDLYPGLAYAIACAFVGGRFEDSIVGLFRNPVFGFDISSAYPYAQTALPCLACGRWRHEKYATPDMLARASLAVARFRVRRPSDRDRRRIAWGPLPFRDEKGSIAYGVNFSGWAWSPELLSALAGWPDLVELTGEAWIYETDCSHRPFHYVPDCYRKRCEWGKEGPGLTMKGGINAGYGKTAQAIGDDPPFQCWPWAGVTTATTRGQLLDGICAASDRWNVLAVATDGIVAAEDLPLAHFDGERWISRPKRPTGTGDLPKPLGGWERKHDESEGGDKLAPSFPEGMAIVKPGLYWRLSPGDTKDVRARGIGRKEAFDAKRRIEDEFLRWDRRDPDFHVPLESRRFYGAKHSVLCRSRCPRCGRSWPGVPEKGCSECKIHGESPTLSLQKDKQGRAAYGRWAPREIRIGFDPYPKREREGLSREGTFARIHVRDLGGRASTAYDVGTHATTPEGQAQRDAREFMLEQPDYSEEIV